MAALDVRFTGDMIRDRVGPKLSWAAADKVSCAYVHVLTDDGSPSRPQANLIAAGARAESVARYIEKIGIRAGLRPLNYRRGADAVEVTPRLR